ncbi:MAG: hypothetical protein ACT6Q9_14140, partial [Polaromonas sp.]|uniref:hypothetical protein n=1 Tax=Polaromonas sp. TaxID=1869339 RepID=UPI00403584CA
QGLGHEVFAHHLLACRQTFFKCRVHLSLQNETASITPTVSANAVPPSPACPVNIDGPGKK